MAKFVVFSVLLFALLCRVAVAVATTATWTCTSKQALTYSAATNVYSYTFEASECVAPAPYLTMQDCASWLAYQIMVDSAVTSYSTQAVLPTSTSVGGVRFKTLNNAAPTVVTVRFRGFGDACTSTCALPSDLMSFTTTGSCSSLTVTDPANLLVSYNTSPFGPDNHKAYAVDAACKVVAVATKKRSACEAIWDVLSKCQALSYTVYGLDGEIVDSTKKPRLMGCDGLFEMWSLPSCTSLTGDAKRLYDYYKGKNNLKAFAVDANDRDCGDAKRSDYVTALPSTLTTCDAMFAATASHYTSNQQHGAVWDINGSSTATTSYIQADPCASAGCAGVCTWCCSNQAQCGMCPLGYTGSPAANVPCAACAIGTYKSTTGSAACTACPAHSTTATTGARDITACACVSGFSGTITSTSSVCVASASFANAKAVNALLQPNVL
eukprot:c4483_g1_i1.p1 GENE.c4483_g1_i1~~c4483_g1_i1.p1  ORF type:complete len:438 (-),score=116.15 c4483_g1_i1:105-1418(-)